MTAIFIISIFVLVLTSLVIYRSKRSTSITDAGDALPPPHFAGLFGNRSADDDLSVAVEAKLVAEREREEHVRLLRVRAERGEREVLLDALARRDKILYDELLASLVAQATGDAAL
ncbi:MAG TPA: hypothetical protein VNA19_12240, partial [Pyrinomonadaceae bacterium]|nr:hypothetical protein [Pyrinomonadaceae bacterium]